MAKLVRFGIVRPLDELGRVVIAKEHLKWAGLMHGDALVETLVVNEKTGRVRGILLEPVQWLANPEAAPSLTDALKVFEKKAGGENSEIDL